MVTLLAAWAIHPSATLSDALSTAFMIISLEKMKPLCAENPSIVAFIVEQNGLLVKTGG